MTEGNFVTFSVLFSSINPSNQNLFQYRLRSANSYTTANNYTYQTACAHHRC